MLDDGIANTLILWAPLESKRDLLQERTIDQWVSVGIEQLERREEGRLGLLRLPRENFLQPCLIYLRATDVDLREDLIDSLLHRVLEDLLRLLRLAGEDRIDPTVD